MLRTKLVGMVILVAMVGAFVLTPLVASASPAPAHSFQVSGGRCDIVNLDLEGLFLDVLGLVVDLDEVNLDVYAQSGEGKLLGNLLCAVVGLLDNTGQSTLGALTNLLNQILGILDSLGLVNSVSSATGAS